MFYIEIQPVDYDDYPIGKPTNVGPFNDEEDAGTYMELSDRFTERSIVGYKYWSLAQDFYGASNRSTISIREVDAMFVSPEEFDERGW